jgi:putative redox protein
VDITIESEGLRLSGHLAKASGTAAGRPRHGLVLCHGFPAGPKAAGTSGETYPELADRLAHETGWSVLTFNFRGTGESDGEFSLAGWVSDLRAAVAVMRRVDGVDEVWVGGFSTGGAVALEVAASDPAIGGVAAFASPADFADWAAEPKRFLAHARDVGVVKTNSFPEDFEAWALELKEIRPVAHIDRIPPRPVLLVHGSDDDIVPLHEARALADAAEGEIELRVITGGGHRLRHDPRAVAVLIGWLERQHPPASAAAPAPPG